MLTARWRRAAGGGSAAPPMRGGVAQGDQPNRSRERAGSFPKLLDPGGPRGSAKSPWSGVRRGCCCLGMGLTPSDDDPQRHERGRSEQREQQPVEPAVLLWADRGALELGVGRPAGTRVWVGTAVAGTRGLAGELRSAGGRTGRCVPGRPKLICRRQQAHRPGDRLRSRRLRADATAPCGRAL